MRALITGGAGFIGSHLVQACLQAGERVRVLDDLSSGRLSNLSQLMDDVEFVEASVTNPDALRRAAQGCQVVYHQAAIASVPRSVQDPSGTHAVNALGTLHVLEASRDAGVNRVVLASSAAVYGEDPRLPKSEDMDPAPESPYALQKLTSELYASQFARLFGLETVALRYFNVFGPRQDPGSGYAGVIPRFADALLARTRPIVYGDGEQTRDFVYVSDVVAANRAAATSQTAVGCALNIGRGEQVSVLELLAQIALQVGVETPDPELRPARSGDVRHSRSDPSAAREHLGWSAQTSLAGGLRETVRYYNEVAA